jgi:hypothetical protein|tara:strand:+ start:476 stop:1114 length:639 start_codon:yes stop_codon:yes gene_type:complete
MGIKFGAAKGQAKKSNIEQYTYKNGDNVVRMTGDLLPRYVYWVTGENNKNLPVECLSFDREAEAFLNKEKDWVREYFPDLKCGWSYCISCIDPSDGKVKVLNLKKKLMEQILVAAEDLGDPTDNETGWDVHFKRVKTGPLAYNVEYQLQALKCKPRALTVEEAAAVSAATPIDELLPRPTPDAQKELLERIVGASSSENTDDEVLEEEFDVA